MIRLAAESARPPWTFSTAFIIRDISPSREKASSRKTARSGNASPHTSSTGSSLTRLNYDHQAGIVTYDHPASSRSLPKRGGLLWFVVFMFAADGLAMIAGFTLEVVRS